MSEIEVDVIVRIPLPEAARLLSPPQMSALMWGIGQVVAATSQIPVAPPVVSPQTPVYERLEDQSKTFERVEPESVALALGAEQALTPQSATRGRSPVRPRHPDGRGRVP